MTLTLLIILMELNFKKTMTRMKFYPSRKRKVSNSSQKKHVAKNGKTSQKPKKANDDLEKSEEPPKKFSHST